MQLLWLLVFLLGFLGLAGLALWLTGRAKRNDGSTHGGGLDEATDVD